MPFTFSYHEYMDMMFVFGQCEGDTDLAQREYATRYPNRITPSKDLFNDVFQYLRDTGTYPGVTNSSDHGERNTRSRSGVRRVQRSIQRSPDNDVRRVSSPVGVPRINQEGMFPYHYQRVQKKLTYTPTWVSQGVCPQGWCGKISQR